MPTTKDWVAHRKHFGKTQYVAAVWKWNPEIEDNDFLGDRTFPNLGLAKAWAKKNTPEGAYAAIHRGKWEEDRFHDEGYGLVYAADFAVDESWGMEYWGESEWMEWG